KEKEAIRVPREGLDSSRVLSRCEVGAAEPVETAVPAATEEAAPEAHSAQRAEEESMLAEAGRNNPSEPRRDPEEAALELLRSELGARPID
ncbi:hypothetical protein B1987_13265, partial [Mycobacterium kansasii]